MAQIKNFGMVGLGSSVQYGKAGPRIKNDSGVIKIRNAADSEDAGFLASTITSSSIFSSAAGTAEAPAITFTGDTNTGLYSSGADTIDFSAGGSNKFSIGSTGITANTGISMGENKVTTTATSFSSNELVTKQYVDGVAQGLDVKDSVVVATVAVDGGVGGNIAGFSAGVITIANNNTAYFTESAAAAEVDGITLVNGMRVLVKNQTNAQENGIYVVTEAGTEGSTDAVLTRADDLNLWTEVPGAFVFVEQGTINADSGWVSTADSGGTINTTAMPWTQFAQAGGYLAGDGLTLTGNTYSVNGSTTIAIVSDNVVVNSSATANQILLSAGTVGTAATFSTATYPSTTTANGLLFSSATNTIGEISTANTAVLVTNNTGVPAYTTGATANRVLRTDGTTISFAQVGLTTDVTGTLPVANGGTGLSTTTANRILYSSADGVIGEISTANTSVLATNNTGVPSYTSGTTANRVLRTDGTTISFAQVALTTDVTGTLPVTNGGTGLSTTTANSLLFSSANDTIGQISTANTAALVTNDSGVPAYTSGTTANRVLRTDGTTISFAQVALATDVSGTLPVTNGGTGLSTTTANSLLFSSAADTIGQISTANTAVLVTNDSGVPAYTTGATANRVLRTDGTTISFAQVGLTTDVTGTLPLANGGTGLSSVAQYSVLVANTADTLTAVSATDAAGNQLLQWNDSNNTFEFATVASVVDSAGSIKQRRATFTQTSGTFNIGAVLPSASSRVIRVRVEITTAFTNNGTLSIGSTGAVTELAAVTEIDESFVGFSEVAINKVPTATQVLGDISASGDGAGEVIIEFI